MHQNFVGTSLDSPITKVAVPLVGVRPDGTGHPSGTACLVAPWLAITATHVIHDYFLTLQGRIPTRDEGRADFSLLTYVLTEGGRKALPLFVRRVYQAKPYDIAWLHLAPGGPIGLDHVWDIPELELAPPEIGSSIAAFGYPKSILEQVVPNHWTVNMDARTTFGSVLEVHPLARDAGLLPFPCFRTNARFDGGMSGGPVFNGAGKVCGLVCSSLPPAKPDGEHVSYVSLLWPSLATMVDIPWDRYPPGRWYPIYEYARAGAITAAHLQDVSMTVNGDGTQTISYTESP